MSDPVTALKRLKQSSGKAEKRLVSYILENLENVTGMTIAGMSEKAEVSYATTVRLVRKLGYIGFPRFKASLADYLKNYHKDFESKKEMLDLLHYDSVEKICKTVCELSSAIISDVRKGMDTIKTEQVIDCILNSRTIYFIGLGTSAVSAHYAYVKLFRLGIPCSHDVDSTLFKMKAALMGPGDTLFAVSSSGRTKSVIEAAQIAKSNGSRVVSLCDFASSPLARASDFKLSTTTRDASKFAKDDFQLVSGQFVIIDIIHVSCHNKMYKNAQQRFAVTKSMADSEKVLGSEGEGLQPLP